MVLALTGIATTLAAQPVYITARPNPSGGGPNTAVNPNTYNLLYNDNGFGNDTSAKSSQAECPARSGGRYFSIAFSNSTPDYAITLSPSLSIPGGVYRLDHTFNSSAGNVSTNVIVGVANTYGCTLSWTNTDKFQSAYGSGSPWTTLGYITNDQGVTDPQLTFYFVGGDVNAGANKRLILDCFRFTLAAPCLATASVGVTGPLSTNVTEVIVTGVTNATKITVYQDSGVGMTQIGQKTTGIVNGNNSVPVTGLVHGAKVAATQTVNNQEGCVPGDGLLVGSGPNPSIRLALSIRCDPTMTGPVGSPGSTTANVFFLGASTLLTGGSPQDAPVIYPSNNWQTITFQRGPDPANPINPYVVFNGDLTSLDGDFGALDGLVMACEGGPGDFDIYIDDLANGTNGVFQNFEGAAGGTLEYVFRNPSFSGSSVGVLSAPDSSSASTNTAATGTKSARIRWQFIDDGLNNWVRLTTSGASPVQNPEVSLNEPISLKLLLLRPGDPVPPPPQPVRPGNIALERIGNTVVLTWAGSYPLQSSSTVTGGWADVGVTTAPYTNTIAAGSLFFRLRSN